MSSVTVETTNGVVAGTEVSGIRAFLGIPYAAPPTGPRRFRPPEPPTPWSGVRPAVEFGPQAPQNVTALATVVGIQGPPDDEDCLSLNVWSPAGGPLRPVMVWIHGGAFIQGTAGLEMFDGTTFARDGVVIVSMNYRLGALGFLKVGGDGAGCFGWLDQVASLEWVRDNIERFGGDPGNVTIFGESAGAMSVALHVVSSRSKGLFHKAAIQSGVFGSFGSPENATAIAARVASACGVPLDGLREVGVDALLAAQQSVGEVDNKTAQLRFYPVLDGVSLPTDPMAEVAAGCSANVPLLVGATRDELTITTLTDPAATPSTRDALVEQVAGVFGDDAEAVVKTYEASRPGASPAEVYVAWATDRYVRIPTIRLAEMQLRAGGRVHSFEFAWPSPAFGGILKACHGLDVPFVFDQLDDRLARVLAGEDPPRSVAAAMHGAWVAFAKSGDPGWAPYDLDARSTMVFDDPSQLVDDLRGAEREVWSSI